jgi:serine/threonine-protein kinase
LLYVTNFDSPPYGGVTVYNAQENNPAPIAVINASIFQPGGDCIDADGTLYVASNPGSSLGWISEYALGTTTPLRIITQGINIPAFCAIDRMGNLWVTNAGSGVTEYLKGSTDPHFTLTNGLTYADGIAIDRAGNIYVGNLNAPTGKSNVQVYRPGKKSPRRTITDGIRWPVGIAVDSGGTLYVTNDVSPCNIEKYRAGQNHPYQTITKDIDGPTALTFGQAGRMYEVNEGASDCASNGPSPVILEFRPHSLSPTKRMISSDLHVPVGDAYYPPVLP